MKFVLYLILNYEEKNYENFKEKFQKFLNCNKNNSFDIPKIFLEEFSGGVEKYKKIKIIYIGDPYSFNQTKIIQILNYGKTWCKIPKKIDLLLFHNICCNH